MPALPRWGLARVRGRSMMPTLVPGDRVLVRYGVPPVPGDVVLVRVDATTIAVKRLTALEGAVATAESDNAAEPGAWSGVVDREAVLGVVPLRVWPRPGRVPAAPSR